MPTTAFETEQTTLSRLNSAAELRTTDFFLVQFLNKLSQDLAADMLSNMLKRKDLYLLVREQGRSLAHAILKIPRILAEPIPGIPENEINYYGFTLIGLLNSPEVNSIKLSSHLAELLLTVVWNYMDGACALIMGVSQLLEEDDYRQNQLKIKGFINILSGIQLFVLTYNPLLVAAFGLAGAPAAFAGIAVAISLLVDVISASIDYHNARKEHDINGWMEEKWAEYNFLTQRIESLEADNRVFELASSQQGASEPRLTAARNAAINRNQQKLEEFQGKQKQLLETITLRAKVHESKLWDEHKKRLNDKDALWRINALTRENILDDTIIQTQLDTNLQKTRDTLIIKIASFIGMSLLAIGTIALITCIPASIPLAGLAISVVVSTIYLYRHQQAIAEKLNAKPTFFQPAHEEEGYKFAEEPSVDDNPAQEDTKHAYA